MSPIKNTIDINGKIYDARTGRHIGSIDDIDELIGNEMAARKPAVRAHTSHPRKKRAHQPLAANRHPERSKTLMRPAVKKPVVKDDGPLKHQQPHRVSLGAPAKARVNRAKTTAKSPKIRRFNHNVHHHAVSKVPKKLAPLPVKEPAHKPASPTPAQNDWPVVDQFERAVQSASSHLEEFVDEAGSSKRNRRFAFATLTLVVLALVGFGAYQAMPIVKVKLAGNKAGFSPSVPSYSPSGYGLADPAAESGEITLPYKSRTDDKGFNITQAPSQWNSQSLVNNFLEPSGKQYQTVRSNGKTIYTYDKANATWVDGGIWFKVESNADLSNEQLIKIANGL